MKPQLFDTIYVSEEEEEEEKEDLAYMRSTPPLPFIDKPWSLIVNVRSIDRK